MGIGYPIRPKTSPYDYSSFIPSQSFGRMPTQAEAEQMSQAMAESGKALNKNWFFIIHGSVMPAAPGENTGFGSLFSNGAKALTQFVKSLGFLGFQLGPDGKTKAFDPSPYESSANSDNELFIDLKQLTTPEWGEILSLEGFNSITDPLKSDDKNSNANTRHNSLKAEDQEFNIQFQYRRREIEALNLPPEEKTKRLLDLEHSILEFNQNKHPVAHYLYAQKEYLSSTGALQKAYQKFKLAPENHPVLSSLQQDFKKFKETHQDWLEKDALYQVLSDLYQNDYYPNWPNPLDKDLNKILKNPQDTNYPQALNRKKQLETTYQEDLDFYAFCQFVVDVQKKKMKAFHKTQGIVCLGDSLIGFSPRDVWAKPEAFLEVTQFTGGWGLPVLNPEKLFLDAEGRELGPSGQVLYDKYKRVFQYYDGVRIDAAAKLYDTVLEGPGVGNRQFPDTFLSRVFSPAARDAYHKIYPNIIQKVIQDHQIPLNLVCAEALADYPPVPEGDWKQAFLTQVLGNIPPIFQGQGEDRLEQAPPKSMAYVTSHDAPSISVLLRSPKETDYFQIKEMVDERMDGVLKQQRSDYNLKNGRPHSMLSYLAGYTCPPDYPGGLEAYKELLKTDNQAFIEAKMVELLLCPAENVQISFMDLFQMAAVYNNRQPGLINWRVRLPDAFKEIYYAKLENNEGVNLPKIARRALEIKAIRENQQERFQPIIERLKQSEAILAEKTPPALIDSEVLDYLAQEKSLL
jgi:4-alpha-glucanotransferase